MISKPIRLFDFHKVAGPTEAYCQRTLPRRLTVKVQRIGRSYIYITEKTLKMKKEQKRLLPTKVTLELVQHLSDEGLTQSQIADRLGVSQPAIAKFLAKHFVWKLLSKYV